MYLQCTVKVRQAHGHTPVPFELFLKIVCPGWGAEPHCYFFFLPSVLPLWLEMSFCQYDMPMVAALPSLA